jgi:hypothetical protein
MTRYLTIAAAALAIGIGGVSADANAGAAAGGAARPIIDDTPATAEQAHYRGRYRYHSYRRSPGFFFYFGTPRYYRPYYYSGPRYYRYW